MLVSVVGAVAAPGGLLAPVPALALPTPRARPVYGELPPIAARMRPSELKALVEERAAPTHARLEDVPHASRDEASSSRYTYSSAIVVNAGLKRTRAAITDYAVYAKLIPYISKAQYSPITRTLYVTGGLWRYVLQSAVQFEEKSDRWIRYRIVSGHFTGLTGNILFEPAGEKGTAVWFDGELTAAAWPPRLIIERGAEIVFGFTAKRMRDYIEKDATHDAPARSDLPQPRKRL